MAKQSGSHNFHAKLAPSASARWLRCTASPSFIDKLGAKDEGSRYADEGTEAHDWATKLLLGQITEEQVPKGFRPHVVFYVEHCLSLVPEGVVPDVELQVPLWYRTKGSKDSGTFDFGFATDDLVAFRDLKYGYKLISAKENTQLAIYAYSYMLDLEECGLRDFHPETRINMGIVQPRREDENESFVREWEITYKELIDFCSTIERTARDIQQGRNLIFVPCDEACEYCPAKAFCQKRAEAVSRMFNGPNRKGLDVLAAFAALDDRKEPDPLDRAAIRLDQIEEDTGIEINGGILSDDKLIEILQARASAEAFFSDVFEHVQQRTLAGDDFGGQTMVVFGKQGNRAYKDEDTVAGFLREEGLSDDQIFDRSVVSPATIEKILPKKKRREGFDEDFADHITRKPASKVMALVDPRKKRRPAQTALDAFAAADASEDPYGEL